MFKIYSNFISRAGKLSGGNCDFKPANSIAIKEGPRGNAFKTEKSTRIAVAVGCHNCDVVAVS